MTDTQPAPLTDDQLDDIEARAARLYEYDVRQSAEADVLAGTDVPALLAEVRRQRAELADAEAEKAKLIRWHGEDEKTFTQMRGTIQRLRTEVSAAQAKTLTAEADEIVAHCPDHGSRDGVWMDCHCAVADDMRRRAALSVSVRPVPAPEAPTPHDGGDKPAHGHTGGATGGVPGSD
ncbi:hypothetical protein [Streptomyces sp. NPDC003832]